MSRDGGKGRDDAPASLHWCFNSMASPPSSSDPLPDDNEDPENGQGMGQAASDPESALEEAEEALANIEALADLDEDPDVGTSDAPPSDAESDADTSGASGSSGDAGKVLEDQCENCGALLHGPYCSECGQRAADRILPIWHMVNEALEAVFELDLRVFRTFPKFVFLPGRLTKEYLNGRRKRYIRPFRLYLFSTFILFAVLAFTTTGNVGMVLDPQGMVRLNPPNTGIKASRSPDTTRSDDSSSFFGNPERREKIAREIESDSTNIHIGLFDNPKSNERFERILRTNVPNAIRNPRDFLGTVIDRGPYLMFLMLPIFALLLKLLYVRRRRLYVEHLIFSLHIHAFTFFAFTTGVLLHQLEVGWVSTIATSIEVSPVLYLVIAMGHVYDQGLIKSTIKASILLTIYSIVLTVGFIVLLILAVLIM